MTPQERLSELSRLEDFFKTAVLPQVPLKMGGFMPLRNIRTFIDTNLSRANLGINSEGSELCILRLRQLEDCIKELPESQQHEKSIRMPETGR